ncbi:SAV_6107 family HEPN domain-containing protein [Corynebacterium amycolatum]
MRSCTSNCISAYGASSDGAAVDQSAWLRLKKEQPEFDSWVAKFEQFTALREEVRLGISRRIDSRRAQELWDLSCAFLGAVRAELGVLPAAA